MSIGAGVQPQRTMLEDPLLQSFLDRAIHDLRASARRIGISTEMLSGRLGHGLAPEGEPCLNHLRNGVGELNSILKAMSSYSVALSAANYTFRAISLKTVLSSALAHIREPITEAGATITHTGLPEVTGDADRLREVFQHLILNALSYRTEERPRINIAADRGLDGWLITVRDNGTGFEPKYSTQVFAPFYRLHGSEIPGVGLGLTICRRVLELHQGRIWIESEKGSGTTCFFTLPAEDAAPA
jgi:light-regulated signal transduction histidine kinase (bacteriophytochrome)